MANIRQIKGRISTAANISKITKAMEMVSASKMRRAQQQALAARAYSRAIHQSLQKVAKNSDPSLHPLLMHHETGKEVIILFSTDRGLCGALNTNLFKATWQWGKGRNDVEVIAIGKKAITFTRKMGLPLAAQFNDLPQKPTAADIIPISTVITQGFLNGQFKSVWMIYMDFINTLSQKVRISQLLPISPEETEIESLTTGPTINSEYTFEPNAQEIFNDLLPYYIENTLYQTLLEAKASEHSARMVSMKNASDNAKALVGELKLLYNKSRQAAITNELLDITTATMTVSS